MDMVTKQTLTFVDTYSNGHTLAYHEPTHVIHAIPNRSLRINISGARTI